MFVQTLLSSSTLKTPKAFSVPLVSPAGSVTLVEKQHTVLFFKTLAPLRYPLEKAWFVRGFGTARHPRGSNATEGSCAAHKLVGGHSVHPRFLQKLVWFWSGRTEFAPTGLRRQPIVCTNRVPLIHPENAEGFFSTPSPQGKAFV